MKYHYQAGVIEKDKKSHKKLWLGFFTTFGVVAYAGFLLAVTALNGWPITPYDNTAKVVKTTTPGSLGNALFVPAINLTTTIGNSLTLQGKPGLDSTVNIQGNKLAPGITPTAVRAASPLFNLDMLKKGDELFVDVGGTRYAYRVTDGSSDKGGLLKLSNGETARYAEIIGTVALQNGQLKIEQL